MAQTTDQRDQKATEIGRLQSLFREVNERIEELSQSFTGHDEMTMLCECGSSECNARIAISEPEYETLRRIPTHFAVLPGHDIPGVERVVETNARYVVVEKFGESAITAIRLDPRRRA
jgi:hypothetical protein